MPNAAALAVPPEFIELETAVSDARAHAARVGVHYLLVRQADELVGLVCLCDLSAAAPDAAVGTVLQSPFLFVEPEASSGEVGRLMLDCRVGCLPVLDAGGVVIGVLTRQRLREFDLLPDLPGVDQCASCRQTHDLELAPQGELMFCRSCLERARPADAEYPLTLGGSD